MGIAQYIIYLLGGMSLLFVMGAYLGASAGVGTLGLVMIITPMIIAWILHGPFLFCSANYRQLRSGFDPALFVCRRRQPNQSGAGFGDLGFSCPTYFRRRDLNCSLTETSTIALVASKFNLDARRNSVVFYRSCSLGSLYTSRFRQPNNLVG